MKARSLLEGSSYPPETLHVIFQAFDEAWSEICHQFPGQQEDTRMRLAHAVLLVAREESDDPQRLKRDALEVLTLAYRERL